MMKPGILRAPHAAAADRNTCFRPTGTGAGAILEILAPQRDTPWDFLMGGGGGYKTKPVFRDLLNLRRQPVVFKVYDILHIFF
jgi:hypothetical protein